MTNFKVIDKKTGKEADVEEIVLHEDWAKGLVYCDIEGFAITEGGELILADECGKFAYCPEDKFEIQFDAPAVEVPKDVLKAYYLGYSQANVDFEQEERPKGRLIIKNHMETCEKCGSVMPMMNDYYRAKLRGCPYCLTEFINLADMREEAEE